MKIRIKQSPKTGKWRPELKMALGDRFSPIQLRYAYTWEKAADLARVCFVRYEGRLPDLSEISIMFADTPKIVNRLLDKRPDLDIVK